MIGQLPKEVGGNYTTGAANVVYELSKRKVEGLTIHVYGTNIPSSKAKKHSGFENQYIGYSYNILRIIYGFIFHPLQAFKEWSHYKNVDHENPLRYFFYKVNIAKAINVVKPDVIHVHSIGNLSCTKFALNGKHIPIVLTCHGIFYRGDASDKVGHDRYYGNIGMADKYTGLTNESLIEYETILGINKDKVTVIPNGVDCAKFYFDIKKREEIRNALGVNNSTLVLITVASVQERKGQLAFVKLLKHLKADWQYWIIGTGPDISAIEDYVAKNVLRDKVRLLGYHTSEELYEYYSAADIYAHVSTMEGQALCEIEANATGLRTIVNKCIVGTIPDLELGDYYILDPSHVNFDEMVVWMKKETPKRTSRTTLDWSSIIKKYYQVYKQALNRE